MILEKLLSAFKVDSTAFNAGTMTPFDLYFERIESNKNTYLNRAGPIEKYSHFMYEGISRCWILGHQCN